MNFNESLATGKAGESEIAKWLQSRGSHVLPIYEIADNQFKGPALYASDGGEIIAPDILTFSGKGIVWIEAKHKSAFTWHRISRTFQTGIDLHHYEEYQRILQVVSIPVWLLFLHKPGQAKDSPPGPSGLFGNSLEVLTRCEEHRHPGHGKHGMVYWTVGALRKLADYPIN